VFMTACRWVGRRRTLSVRALSAVTALVLSHDDMRWAVMHDYRQSDELMAALKARKLTVVRAMRDERHARRAAAEAAAAAATSAEV
jgi:hypothetical protein